MSFLAPGGANAVGPTSGGKVYAYNNVSTTAAQVLQTNPQRTTASFHNPGSVNIYIAPALVQGLNSAGAAPSNVTLSPSNVALGGCWLVPGGSTLVLTGECAGAYQAFAASGITNPLTVSESNV